MSELLDSKSKLGVEFDGRAPASLSDLLEPLAHAGAAALHTCFGRDAFRARLRCLECLLEGLELWLDLLPQDLAC